MKSSLDILSKLYCEINVPEINEEIKGEIYIGDPPDTNQTEDISINTLNNPNNYVQSGFINLNIYVKQLSSGRANLGRFQQILDRVMPIVEDLKLDRFWYQIHDDKGVFKDQDRDYMYFYNLKLSFQTI